MSEEKGRDVTRRELAEALEASQALNARLSERLDALEAKAAAPTLSVQQAVLERELANANAELKDKRELLERARSRPGASGPDVPLVPYAGFVKAMAKCYAGGGIREVGAVFQVDLPALYTDDPFIAVNVVGEYDDGSPKTEPNLQAPVPINFRFRKVISAAEDPTPRRAAEY